MTYLYVVAGWIAATALTAAAYDALCRRRRLLDFLDWCFEHCIDLRGLSRREPHHYAQHHQLLVHVGYDLAALGRRLAAIQQLTDMPARERLRALLLDDGGRGGWHERHGAAAQGPGRAGLDAGADTIGWHLDHHHWGLFADDGVVAADDRHALQGAFCEHRSTHSQWGYEPIVRR